MFLRQKRKGPNLKERFYYDIDSFAESGMLTRWNRHLQDSSETLKPQTVTK